MAAFLVERLGRRPVLVGFLCLSALFAYLLSRAGSPHEVLLYGSLLSFFNLGAWGAIYAYTPDPELFPTALRGSGAGLAAAVGRVGGILAPYATGAFLPLMGPGGVLALQGGSSFLRAFSPTGSGWKPGGGPWKTHDTTR